jgi:hypothetical protein
MCGCAGVGVVALGAGPRCSHCAWFDGGWYYSWRGQPGTRERGARPTIRGILHGARQRAANDG